MGRQGWGGSQPAGEAQARARIIAATIQCLDRNGPRRLTISAVAVELGVTHQTVYRYYPDLDSLLVAVSEAAAEDLLADMDPLFKGCDDPAEFVVETTAYVIERLPESPHLALPLLAGRVELFERGALASTVIARTVTMLHERTAIDWADLGYDDQELTGLVEFLLRIIQSTVVAPPERPRDGEQLRAWLRRWVAPAVRPAGPG